MLRAALLYARLGFAVFPTYSPGPNGRCRCGNLDCTSPAKHPWVPHGCMDASRDPAAIRAMFERRPHASVSIATGLVSGLFVLDVDPRHTGDVSLEILENEYGRLPETPTVLTGGGGLQFYWRWHAGVDVRNSSGEIGAGLDIRGRGGYVVAPPSLHLSGRRYAWEFQARIDEIPLADPPAWLLDLILHPPARGHGTHGRHLPAGRVSFQSLAAGIPDGKRDVELFRMACALRRQRFTRALAEKMVLDAARRCKPPVPDRVARQKIKSAWRYL
jgi:hypothetical protein